MGVSNVKTGPNGVCQLQRSFLSQYPLLSAGKNSDIQSILISNSLLQYSLLAKFYKSKKRHSQKDKNIVRVQAVRLCQQCRLLEPDTVGFRGRGKLWLFKHPAAIRGGRPLRLGAFALQDRESLSSRHSLQ